MAQIPTSINGVAVEFGSTVGNNVVQSMIEALSFCIMRDIASGYQLSKIYISSAYDSHEPPSRHMQHKAVDISRINGTKIALGYQEGGSVKAIVDAIQEKFEEFHGRRENFGPHFKKRLGKIYTVNGHADHIHLSVN